MLKSEEIESWNEIFVDGKIQESDLKHPTDLFLVKTLVAYLRKFGYYIETPFGDSEFSADNFREKRLFLVRLARKIDSILKYTNKSYSFMYYDLVKPVPKKTSDMLGILFNNYYYYEMFKDEVFSLANGRLKEYQNLIFNKEKIQRENQEQKILSQEIKEEITKLSADEPKLKADLKLWNTKMEQSQTELEKECVKLEELKKQLSDLCEKERNLKKEIVDDSESIKLKNELNELEKSIKELQELKNSTESTLKDRMESIANLENLLKHIEIVQEIFPAKMLQEYKEITAKLKKSKQQHAAISEEITTITDTINKQEEELKLMSEKLKTEKQQSELDKASKLKIIEEKENIHKSLIREVNCLKSLNENMNSQLEEQKRMQNYIDVVKTQILFRNNMKY